MTKCLLKFLCRKNQFLTPELRRLLRNAIIQPDFDYTWSAWYPNLTQQLKKKPQVMQKKCIHFCIQLDKISTISHKEFKDLNSLRVITRFKQCVISIVFKFINNNRPYYLNEIFRFASEGDISLRNNFLKYKHWSKCLTFYWSFQCQKSFLNEEVSFLLI